MTKFKLSPQQLAVLNWSRDPKKGNLTLIARAGCGKTSTLVELTQDIIAHIPQRRFSIFIGAYNRSIAAEIKGILQRLKIDWKTAQAGTLHSAGMSTWRYRNKTVRVEDKKMADVIKNIGSPREIDEFGSFTEKLVSLAKGQAFGCAGMPDHRDPTAWYDLMERHAVDSDLGVGIDPGSAIMFAIEAYRKSLEWCPTIIDYDDMILAPLFFKIRPWQHDWVLIDEVQDLNPARRALAFALMKPGGRFLGCGDDKQAIYGFTGADADGMAIITDMMKSDVLPLNRTFRCPKRVVALAQTWVPDIEAADTNIEGKVRRIPLGIPDAAGGRKRKKADQCLWDETLTAHDVILCRNTAPLIELAYAMIKRGMACRVEGRDIGKSLLTIIRKWKTVSTIDQLVDRVEKFKADQVARYLKRGRESAAQAVEDRCDTILILCDQMLEEGKTKLTDLVSFIERLFQTSKPGEDQKMLTLSTLHKSKGREWPRVYLLGRDKYQPSPYAKLEWEAEQERNLMYVAVTRAQKEFIDVVVE